MHSPRNLKKAKMHVAARKRRVGGVGVGGIEAEVVGVVEVGGVGVEGSGPGG